MSLGTIFSDSEVLASVVETVAANPVDVVATLGLALPHRAWVLAPHPHAGAGDVQEPGRRFS